jgi:outer membrane protein
MQNVLFSRGWVLAVWVAFFAVCTALTVSAAEFKIGLADMQKALQNVEAGKSAKAKLEKEFNAKKKELQAEEANLKKTQAELSKQMAVLSDDARAKKQQEFQERVMKFQEAAQKAQMEIQQKEQEATAPIIAKLKELIKSVASEKGYALVLEKNENVVLYSKDADDLTDELIKQHNAKK